MRKVLAFVTAGLLCLPVSAPAQSAPPQPAAAGGRTVTILHFNDVYEITPVDGGKAGGLARVAALRARLKARHPDLVTTLGGDYLSPSALGTARVNGERLNGRQMVAVLNLLGLDWATLGNHEFDIPEAAFRARLAESKFRIVASNVTDAAGALFPGTVPDAVVPVKTPSGLVRIGLIGLTIDANKQPWVRYTPAVDAAQAAVARLKGKCDVIVALTHLALDGDRQIAEQVPEIDLILGGHEHENWVIERGPNFTPIVKADANVRTVAVVTIRDAASREAAARGRSIIRRYLERIDDTMKEGPRTSRGSPQVAGPGLRRLPQGRLRARGSRRGDSRTARGAGVDHPQRADPDDRAHPGRDAPRGRDRPRHLQQRLHPARRRAPRGTGDAIRHHPRAAVRRQGREGDVHRPAAGARATDRRAEQGHRRLPADRRHPGDHRAGGALHAGDQRLPAHRRGGEPRIPDPPEPRDQRHHRFPGHQGRGDRGDQEGSGR